MAEDKIFPTILEELNTYFGIAIPWLNSEKIRLAVPAIPLAALNLLYTDPATGWTFIYPKTMDETTATKSLRNQRNTLRTGIEEKMREIFDDIPKSKLNAEDRVKLRLKAPDTVPTDAITMDHAPNLDIEKTDHLQHTLRFNDPETPDSSAMPDKQKVVLEYFVGAADLTPIQILWANSRNITHFLHKVPFTDAEVGKTVYYHCCYENTHSQRSVMSATVSRLIG